MIGIIGKKLGMTQIFNEQGQQIPCTVVEAEPNPVLAGDRQGRAPASRRCSSATASSGSRARVDEGREEDAARPSRARGGGRARQEGGSRRGAARAPQRSGSTSRATQGRRSRRTTSATRSTVDDLRAGRAGEGHRHDEGSRLPGRREALRLRRRSEHARQHEAPPSRLHRTRHRSVARHQGQEDAGSLRRRAAHADRTCASRRSTPSAI